MISQDSKQKRPLAHRESIVGIGNNRIVEGGDEFTYEYYSRAYNADDQEPATDEVQKVPVADDKNKPKNAVEILEENQSNFKPDLVLKELPIAKKKKRKSCKKLRKKKKIVRRKKGKKRKVITKVKTKNKRIKVSKLKRVKRKGNKLKTNGKKKKKRILRKKSTIKKEIIQPSKEKPLRLKQRLRKRSKLKTQVQMLPKSSPEEN